MTIAKPQNDEPPKLFSHDETSRILDAIQRTIASAPESSQHYLNACRDGAIIELALMTGLREHEITSLDIGDIFDASGLAAQIVRLRIYKGHKRSKRRAARQKVALSSHTRELLGRFYEVKRSFGQSLAADAPLFLSRCGRRLSTRTVRHWFARWKLAADVANARGFHGLRHTAVTRMAKLYPSELTRLRDFARHSSDRTTSDYLHTMSDEMTEASERLAAVTHGQRMAPSADLLAAAERLAAFQGNPGVQPSVPPAHSLIIELLGVLMRHAAPGGTDGTGF